MTSLLGMLAGAKAGGGPVESGKPYLVGEQGPEVVVPGSSGTVIPNGATVERVVNWCLLHDSVAVLGLAYKPGTPVVDESLGLQVAKQLRRAGVMVSVYDPVAVTDGRGYASYLNAQAAIRHSDAVLVATAWPEFAEVNVDCSA